MSVVFLLSVLYLDAGTEIGHCLIKNVVMSDTHVSKQDILSCTLLPSSIYGKSFKLKLVYHVIQRIVKSLYTFIQRTFKREHILCRQLSLYTFTLTLAILDHSIYPKSF